MAEKQVGVSPVSSIDTLSYLFRALRRRGVFGEVLDTSLENLARALGPAMPGKLFPDTYLVQPLVGTTNPRQDSCSTPTSATISAISLRGPTSRRPESRRILSPQGGCTSVDCCPPLMA